MGGGGGITKRRIKENAILYATDYIWEHSTVSRASHPPYDIASYFIDFLLFLLLLMLMLMMRNMMIVVKRRKEMHC